MSNTKLMLTMKFNISTPFTQRPLAVILRWFSEVHKNKISNENQYKRPNNSVPTKDCQC